MEVDPLKFLEDFRARLLAEREQERQETERRRQDYERMAGLFLTPSRVEVEFSEIPPEQYFPYVYGDIMRREDNSYRIRIMPGLDRETEHSVLCHEIAHGMKGHAKPCTPEDVQRGSIARETITSGRLNVAAGVDVSAIYWRMYAERERQADDVARELFSVLFPGELYRF